MRSMIGCKTFWVIFLLFIASWLWGQPVVFLPNPPGQSNSLPDGTDALTWVLMEKTIYTHDENKNLTMELTLLYDLNTGEEYNYRRVTHFYNDSGYLTTTIDADWIPEQQDWVNREKYERSYNNQGILWQGKSFQWNPDSGKWLNRYWWQDIPCEEDTCILSFSYSWVDSTQQWYLNYNRKSVSNELINGNGKQVVVLTYERDTLSGQWMIESREQTDFDQNGYVKQTTIFYWDSITSEWYPGRKFIRIIDKNGRVTHNEFLRLDLQEQEWYILNTDDYIYDEHANMRHHVYWAWNKADQKWSPGFAQDYLYDKDGHNLETIYYQTDVEDHPWIVTDKDEYDYDEQGLLAEARKYYPQESNTHANADAFRPVIFPNPVKDILVVETAAFPVLPIYFDLYDMTGRHVLSRELQHTIQLYVGYLKTGVYLYRITTDEQSFSGKLVIR
jgi:hypothetical protein